MNQHFVQENKDRSIFRKNIGRALLARDGDPFIEQWEIDLTTRIAKQAHAAGIDFARQSEVERQVTKYIQQNFSFAVFCVNDKDARLKWESRIISTVSGCSVCRPSGAWLGNYSPKEKIRQGGLWLVNELNKEALSGEELGILREIVRVNVWPV
ncbi:MAG TPA: hypothetical protein PKM21_02860 [Anaerolineales bacterium]|nr:hypothetical protein [Anaerolineales bacterium]